LAQVRLSNATLIKLSQDTEVKPLIPFRGLHFTYQKVKRFNMKPLIPPPKIDETKYQVEYHLGSDPNPNQQDSIFYTGMDCVATVKYEGFVVDVFCDGETRAYLKKDGEVVSTLTTPKCFIEAGIETDDALVLANENNLLDWVNNSWFDLYCYGEHLDCVSHDLSEAISFAKTYVADAWVEAEMLVR